jgi:glucans biosynthesis protein C
MLFSLNRKTTKQFVRDRLKRLGIPLIFFTFFVFLPFNYIGSSKSISIYNFFIDTYFNRPPIAMGHLWFVASLLLYSLLYILFSTRTVNVKPLKPFKSFYIPIYILMLTIVSAFVKLYFPIDDWHTWLIPLEVAHIPQYCSLFFIGVLFNKNQWLDKLKLLNGILFFLIAAIIYAVNIYLPNNIKSFWLFESLIEAILCVGISIGILTTFKYFGNKSTNFLKSFSNNAYGIYLLHLLIVIALQKLIVPFQISANLKFVFVFVVGTFLSFSFSILIRKIMLIKAII